MEMARKVENELLSWMTRRTRQPLLLLGARQVGKTFTAQRFGRQKFVSTVTLNFQTDLARLQTVFEGRLDPHSIIENIGYLTGTKITPGQTLLIMDEVQLCPAALTSLKYFAEQAPEYAIIATGSQFGVSVDRHDPYTFPVGKVDIVHMFPLDLEEFLWAMDEQVLADGIRASAARRQPFIAHDDAMRLTRQYMTVGGLPRAVEAFTETGSWEEVRRIQRDLASMYVADMALYADPTDAVRTRQIWVSAPYQLARDNRKFTLASMQSGARFHQFETSFAWLEAAGLIYRHYQTEEPVAPLRPRSDGTFFKTYLFDVGILSAQLGVIPQTFCNESGYMQISSTFRGGIVENYVKQALGATGLESQYWSSGNAAEIDFLLVDPAMRVIPMEVKSGDNTRSRSLDSYRAKFAPAYSIRLSTKNIGDGDDLAALPLYAAFCLPDTLAARIG